MTTSTLPPICTGSPDVVEHARATLLACGQDVDAGLGALHALDVAWSGRAAGAYRDALTDAGYLLNLLPYRFEQVVRLLDVFAREAADDAAVQVAAAAAGPFGGAS